MTTATTSIPADQHAQPLSSLQVKPAPRRYPGPIWTMLVLFRFMRGYVRFWRTGENTSADQADMRRLFRMTNGRFNDAVARLESVLHPPRRLPSRSGVLGDLTDSTLKSIASDLRGNGFHRFTTPLPKPACNRLFDFARRAPCRVSPAIVNDNSPQVFDPNNVRGTQYQVDPQILHENPDVQRLIMDMSLLSVAQAYLGCLPVCLGCDLWWSTAFSDKPSSEAAQLFHFDMSQIKFLKIFMYLTDVDENSGPHSYVLGSHRRAPRALLADRRYADDEIRQYFPNDRILSVAGPAGSIFAEDTRGFHKGTPLRRGHRLILQLLYAVSGFGEAIAPVVVNERFLPEFVDMTRRLPRVFSRAFRNATA